MRYMVLSACLTALTGGAAVAEQPTPTSLAMPSVSGQSASQNLDLGVTQTDGTVSIVFASEPDSDQLEYFLSLMVISTADQVRFSATYDLDNRNGLLEGLEAFIGANGVPWHVCRGWWMSPDDDYSAALIREDFGGSLVFIDNGQSSDVVDNPEADLNAALTADPVFAGMFGSDPRRVESGEEYFNAVTAFWSQVVPKVELIRERQKKGGWVDGC